MIVGNTAPGAIFMSSETYILSGELILPALLVNLMADPKRMGSDGRTEEA